MSSALETTNLRVRYGPVVAVEDASLSLPEGQLVAVLGANGAGKTSTLRAITGLERVDGGSVRLFGEEVTNLAPHLLVARGLVHVPERRRIFGAMSVRENLELGSYLYYGQTQERERHFEQVLTLFPRLKERLKQLGGMLSGGEQQMLAIGRALMAKPRVLVLDEPSLGLSPQATHLIYQTVQRIVAAGTTVLLVEQNARLALKLASYVYILRTGMVAMSGPASQFADESVLTRAYLGAEA